jgi:hypothetical protein
MIWDRVFGTFLHDPPTGGRRNPAEPAPRPQMDAVKEKLFAADEHR